MCSLRAQYEEIGGNEIGFGRLGGRLSAQGAGQWSDESQPRGLLTRAN